MAEPQKTGIKNADELIALATAYRLTVTVDTREFENITSYVVRIAVQVPAAYAGTALGQTIASDTISLIWTKSNRKGARGRLDDATRRAATTHWKLRTLRAITAAVEGLGHDAATYARDAAPLPDDVVDAPHALYINGELRKENIAAERVRTFVKNRRFKGLLTHQDADGGIVCDTRRYVPMPSAPAEETPAPAEERMHVRIVDGGTPEIIPTRDALAEINLAMMEGKRDVREMSAARSTARIVYKDSERGTVELSPATAEDLAPTAPTARPVADPAPAVSEAYAWGVRLEAQQLGTNQVIEERARKSLAAVMHEEAEEGKAGFVFRTNPRGAWLRGVTAEGDDWPLLTEALRLHLEHYGWLTESSRSFGMRIVPPGDAGALVMEGQRRSVATAHAQALTENATQELRAVILAVADLMDEDEARTRAAYGAAQTIPVSMAGQLISGALTRVRGDFDATYVDLLRNKSQSTATDWAARGNTLCDQAFTALYPDGLRSRPLTAEQVRATANAPKSTAQH